MKRVVIIGCLFLFTCSKLFAQEEFKFDTAFANISSVKYFDNNPSIKTIEFTRFKDNSTFLYIYPKLIWEAKGFETYSSQKKYKQYNSDFLGDTYLLEKKYGHLELPENELNIFSKRKTCVQSYNYLIKGVITKDSIHLQLAYKCNNDPEVQIFEKIEIGVGYVGGIKKLKQQLEFAIKEKNIKLENKSEDSVLIFDNLLNNKDSVLKRIELIEGNYSDFSQLMLNELNKSGPWSPPIQGGRSVKAYFKIFIRLNKDKSLTVAIPER